MRVEIHHDFPIYDVRLGDVARFTVRARTEEAAKHLVDLYSAENAFLDIETQALPEESVVAKPLDPIAERIERINGFHEGDVKYLGECSVKPLVSLADIPITPYIIKTA